MVQGGIIVYFKNMLFRFKTDDSVKIVPLKTIKHISRVYDGILKIRTNDCVTHTISMQDKSVWQALEYYDSWLWEKDNGIKSVEFQTYSSVSRLDLGEDT